jgi:hypothetical protein
MAILDRHDGAMIADAWTADRHADQIGPVTRGAVLPPARFTGAVSPLGQPGVALASASMARCSVRARVV